MAWKQKLLTSALCLIGVMLWGACESPEPEAGPAPKSNPNTVETSDAKLAPQFSLTDLDGNPMNSNYAGKITLVNFWASWCGPCRMEIPDFVELYSAYKDRGVEIIGISLDHEGPEKVRSFAAKYQINYPVGMIDKEQKVASAFGGFRGIPTTFIVDQQGRIFKRYVGVRSKAVFENDIKTLLGQGE
ncbi:MAG: TlpA disulfide reductase family protein [Candidatus Latescibacterota bacterium]